MNSKGKKTIVLIIVSLVTVALGAIAVVTSLQLRKQTAEGVPVAPTAPESQPKAALENNNCELSFDVSPSTCDGWCDSNDDCGTYAVGGVDVQLECYQTSGASSGYCRNPSCSDEADCECPIELVVCNETCTADEECSGNLICDTTSGTCRDVECTEEATCVCPLATCNEACSVDADCEIAYICDVTSGTCRDEDYPEEADCTPPEATPTPTPTPTPTSKPTPTPTPIPTPPPGEHLECDEYDRCVPVIGDGANLCEYDSDCAPAPATSTPEPTLPTAGGIIPTTTLLSVGTLLLMLGAVAILAL